VQLGRATLPDPLTRAEILARALKLQVGRPFPDLVVKTMAGTETPFRKQLQPGRRTLINLWATWCVPCKREMPELEQLRASLATNGVDLIGLNVDADPEAKITQFLTKTIVQYPIYVGGVPALEQLFAGDEVSVPLSVLLDEHGNVIDLIPGWSGETKRKLLRLAGQPVESSSVQRQN
jgi:thiol-disulfide isomerase/thioredoxin